VVWGRGGALEVMVVGGAARVITAILGTRVGLAGVGDQADRPSQRLRWARPTRMDHRMLLYHVGWLTVAVLLRRYIGKIMCGCRKNVRAVFFLSLSAMCIEKNTKSNLVVWEGLVSRGKPFTILQAHRKT